MPRIRDLLSPSKAKGKAPSNHPKPVDVPKEPQVESKAKTFLPKVGDVLPKLTFGCEFEFILACCTYPKRARDLSEGQTGIDHAFGVTRRALSETMTARCNMCTGFRSFKLDLHYEDTDPSHQKWSIGPDVTLRDTEYEASIVEKEDDYYVFSGLELRSRKFEFAKPKKVEDPRADHRHQISHEEEIKAVFERLRKVNSFGSETTRTTYYLHCNPSCGFHVHIGNGDQAFDFTMIRKLFSVFVACERQIDGLHSTHRIMGTNLATTPFQLRPIERHQPPRDVLYGKGAYNKSLSLYFMIEAHNRRNIESNGLGVVENSEAPSKELIEANRIELYPDRMFHIDALWKARMGNNIDSWLTLVQHAPDVRDLHQLYRSMGRWCTLNLSNLPAEGISSWDVKGTIEFRQHAGTLHSDEILSFLDFVMKLVSFCKHRSDKNFGSLIAPGGKFRAPSFSTLDLCRDWLE